ncbi:unnamed protein product [Mytilus edulis]|uniref:Uncharacterized protein n=1 Tax=Mytilus edulis TaxID=6550 RepID=A0A8S3T7N2_MYTED|nr:unnamed protein product [Mytilus edulis]
MVVLINDLVHPVWVLHCNDRVHSVRGEHLNDLVHPVFGEHFDDLVYPVLGVHFNDMSIQYELECKTLDNDLVHPVWMIDPCSEKRYTVIDDYRRSPNYNAKPSERRLCDNRIKHGWYRFKINGSDAEMPTTCIPHGCGTRAPIWLPLPADGLPSPGKKIRTQACASFEVPGREF